MIEHEKICQFMPIRCDFCQENVIKAELRLHQSRICAKCYECKICKTMVGAKVEDVPHKCLSALSTKLQTTIKEKDSLIYHLTNRLNEKDKEIRSLYQKL